jgi:O-succinylbenzoate synthase
VLEPAVLAVPLRDRFRGLTVREVVLLQGPAGWAEWSPFLEYDDAEAATWWAAATEAATQGWPDPVRDRVPVNATVPAVDAARVPAVLAGAPGCRTAKVKVAERGQREADDLARLEAVRGVLGPGGRVRIDVNGAWTAAEALDRLPRYDAAAGGLEYVEQPCRSVEELALVRAGQGVPVAADESVRRADDPRRVVDLEAADLVVLKVQPLGGVRAALALAAGLGVPVVVSSALETSVGLAAGVALAAALPELPYDCGLGTAALLTDDPVRDSLLPIGGSVPVGRPTVLPEALERLRAPADRERWWRDRMGRVAAMAGREAG